MKMASFLELVLWFKPGMGEWTVCGGISISQKKSA